MASEIEWKKDCCETCCTQRNACCVAFLFPCFSIRNIADYNKMRMRNEVQQLSFISQCPDISCFISVVAAAFDIPGISNCMMCILANDRTVIVNGSKMPTCGEFMFCSSCLLANLAVAGPHGGKDPECCSPELWFTTTPPNYAPLVDSKAQLRDSFTKNTSVWSVNSMR